MTKIEFKNGSVINIPQKSSGTRGLRSKYIKMAKYQ